MKISVVLATYKEKENITKLISAILKTCKKNSISCEVIIVDDNSPDGTADVVRKSFAKNKNVKLIVRKDERGLGTAVGRGIKASTGDVVIFMDSDFSHEPELIPEIMKKIKDYDIVNGSRYLKGGGLETKFYRKLLANIMRIYMTIVLQLNITDYTNGYIAIRRSILDKLDQRNIFYGYGDYYFRLFYRAMEKGASIAEVPSHYRFREGGESKTHLLKHGWQYIREALKLRFT